MTSSSAQATTLADLARLKPSFAQFGEWGQDELLKLRYPQLESVEHVHTPAIPRASSTAPGLVLIGNERAGRELGLKPRARIVATALVGTEPTIMLEGPAPAARKALAKAGLKVEDIDLFELNEAFAAVVLRFQALMGVPDERINVNGGAIAMGHPIGATGAMILGTLLDELERRNLRARAVHAVRGRRHRHRNHHRARVIRALRADPVQRGAGTMGYITLNKGAEGIVELVFDQPGSSVNTMGLEYDAAMKAAVAELQGHGGRG
jgi:acetyl-CoA acetyltransferase